MNSAPTVILQNINTTSSVESSPSGSLNVDLIPPITINLIFGIIGIVTNGLVVIATIRQKTLHNPCNWFIAFNALGELGSRLGLLSLAYTIYTGTNFIELKSCYYIQFIPLFCISFGIIFNLILGIDRFLSVLFPTSYPILSKPMYILLCGLLGGCYALAFLILGYFSMNDIYAQGSSIPTFCVITNGITGQARRVWINVQLVVLVSMLLVYIAFWAYMKFKNKSTAQQHVMRALTTIMLCIVLGWLFTIISMFVYTRFAQSNSFELNKWVLYVGLFSNFSCATNYFILFKFSSEYRAAFQKQLWFVKRSKQVGPNGFIITKKP